MSINEWISEYKNLSLRAYTIEKECCKVRTAVPLKQKDLNDTSTNYYSIKSYPFLTNKHHVAIKSKVRSKEKITHSSSSPSTQNREQRSYLSQKEILKRLESLKKHCREAQLAIENIQTFCMNDKSLLLMNGTLRSAQTQCQLAVENYERECDAFKNIYKSEQLWLDEERNSCSHVLSKTIAYLEDELLL